MEHTAAGASRPLAEISWILMPPYRQDRIAPEVAVESIGIACAKTLEVSLCSLPKSRITILGLAVASHEGGNKEHIRSGRALPEEMELLLRAQRRSVRVIHHVEIRHDAQNALLLLVFKVLGGLVVR